jgi:ParB/RepB/Spo0J family partition protein
MVKKPKRDEPAAHEYSFVPISRIVESGANPEGRTADIKELTESVKEKGIIQPVIVRPADNNKLEIVCGHRRYAAARAARHDQIPVIIRNISHVQAIELQAIENLQRENLNAIDEARTYDKLIKEHKYSVPDLSNRINKSTKHISNRIRLLDLPDDIIDEIQFDTISPAHGLVILRLPDQKARMQLTRAIINKKMSVPAAENVLGRLGRSLTDAPFDTKSCVKCQFNGTSQRDLFDKDTNLAGRCLNAACYDKKVPESFKAAGKKKAKAKPAINVKMLEEVKKSVRQDAEGEYMLLFARGLRKIAGGSVCREFFKLRGKNYNTGQAERELERYRGKLPGLFVREFCAELLILMDPSGKLLTDFNRLYKNSTGAKKTSREHSIPAAKETDKKNTSPKPQSRAAAAKSKSGKKVTITGGEVSPEAAQGLADILGGGEEKSPAAIKTELKDAKEE